MAESRHRVTVPEAARLLGTTEGAVRKRIERGSLHHEKAPDGRVYVRVDDIETRGDIGETPGQRLVEQYEARIESLEHQLEEANTRDREHRRLLAAALERIPEIEAAHSDTEQRGSSASGSEEAPEGTPTPPPERITQSRWQRLRRAWRGE